MSAAPARKLSHELANQLGIVASYAELLLEELGEANANYHDVETIDQTSRQLLRLFDGVASVNEVGEARRRQYTERMMVLEGACASLHASAAADERLAADVREMIKATEAVAALLQTHLPHRSS
jgi:uncharacterized protein with ACT and thioredoxin-like domain